MRKAQPVFIATLALALVAFQAPALAQAPQTPEASRNGALPDAGAFLDAPPAPGGPADIAERALLRGPWTAPRIAQAREDDAVDPFAAFDSVLGEGFRADRLPQTTALLASVTRTAGALAGPPKERYRRARPFTVDAQQPTCVALTPALRASYSYPSGHAAIGWAWALVLAELEPSHADALLARGRDFGDSRVVCGLHWPSDIEAGRLLGAAAVARLHADGTFLTQLQAARIEMNAVISAPR